MGQHEAHPAGEVPRRSQGAPIPRLLVRTGRALYAKVLLELANR